MRSGSSTLKAVLQGSFDCQFYADVFLNRQRVLANLPITNVVLNDDSTSAVQGSGSFSVAYQGDFADSIAPKQIGDTLSPFGSQVAISAIVTAGSGFVERIPMGTYLISETPAIATQMFLFNTALLSKGDLIDVTVKDLFYGVQRDRFNVPGSPASLSSVWGEVQRLTGLPVTKTITDAVIPLSVAYAQDKLQAVYDLATVLDAAACMTFDGTVSMRPNVWPAVVDTLSGGDGGTLINVGRGMANDTVYNAVVVRSADSGTGQSVLASAEVQSGPLRTTNTDGSLSPYRRVPYFASSPYVTTQAQAAAYAATLLPRVSALRSVTVDLVETFNPLRDLGDVITVQRVATGKVFESFTGRVTKISRNGIGNQTTTVAVNQ